MSDKPPLFIQETDYSCVPACLRMVLASSGKVKTEQELRDLCDCSPLDGTAALKAVDAARALGFTETCKQNLSFGELKTEMERGLFPIAFISTLLTTNKPSQKHAVVIVAISEQDVQVLDPARGEITFSLEEFIGEWNVMFRLTILVE